MTTTAVPAKKKRTRKPKEQPILAWHFIHKDMTTVNGNLPVVVGETLAVEGEIELCANGLHASVKALDALSYAKDTMICRVEVWGDVQHDTDKIAGRYRQAIWALDIETLLHEFACDIAESALLAERAAGREPDPRSFEVISCKRRWLKGEASDEDLTAASVAARAASVAAWAAREAAWAASEASVAARAASVAARAASVAAREAARAASVAARAEFNSRLEARIMELVATQVVS